MLKYSLVWILALSLASPVLSCGIATHAWVSKVAMTKVTTPSLRNFVEDHRWIIYNASYFPDSGYSEWVCNAYYGETAHWTPFMNEYLAYIKETCRLPSGLVSTTGECGALIAHFLGSSSHALTDSWHDSHFIVKMVELGLFPDAEAAQTVTDRGLDSTAVNEPLFGIMEDIPDPAAKPPLHHLVTVLNRTIAKIKNAPETTLEIVTCGTELMSFARFMEPIWAYYKEPEYLLLVPQWALQNRLTAAGGVNDSGAKIAEFWEEFWIQITEKPANKYQPKRLREDGGWPQVRVSWESIGGTKTRTRTP